MKALLSLSALPQTRAPRPSGPHRRSIGAAVSDSWLCYKSPVASCHTAIPCTTFRDPRLHPLRAAQRLIDHDLAGRQTTAWPDTAAIAIDLTCRVPDNPAIWAWPPFVSPPPDPRAAPRPREDWRLGRCPPPTRSPGFPRQRGRGARQPSHSPRCRRASARPDAANPSALPAAFSAGGACRRRTARPGGRRGRCMVPGHLTSRLGACTGGSRLRLPGLRLAFQKCYLAAETWWAQLGSNHRPLACKAKTAHKKFQLTEPVSCA